MGGGVVGASRLDIWQAKHREQLQLSYPSTIHHHQQPPLSSGYRVSMIQRNVVAAILYFSVYDGISSLSSSLAVSPSSNLDTTTTARSPSSSSSSSSSSCTKKGTLDIVVGGALAGVAH